MRSIASIANSENETSQAKSGKSGTKIINDNGLNRIILKFCLEIFININF